MKLIHIKCSFQLLSKHPTIYRDTTRELKIFIKVRDQEFIFYEPPDGQGRVILIDKFSQSFRIGFCEFDFLGFVQRMNQSFQLLVSGGLLDFSQ